MLIKWSKSDKVMDHIADVPGLLVGLLVGSGVPLGLLVGLRVGVGVAAPGNTFKKMYAVPQWLKLSQARYLHRSRPLYLAWGGVYLTINPSSSMGRVRSRSMAT